MADIRHGESHLSSVRIFISYASEDRRKAKSLYERLQGVGYTPWMAHEDILGGEDWERSIWRAVHNADFFIVLLTANSVVKRGFLQREISKALDKWREKL